MWYNEAEARHKIAERKDTGRFVVGKTNDPNAARIIFDTMDEVEWYFDNVLMNANPDGVLNGEYYIDDMKESE